jgi:hypothetical protein
LPHSNIVEFLGNLSAFGNRKFRELSYKARHALHSDRDLTKHVVAYGFIDAPRVRSCSRAAPTRANKPFIERITGRISEGLPSKGRGLRSDAVRGKSVIYAKSDEYDENGQNQDRGKNKARDHATDQTVTDLDVVADNDALAEFGVFDCINAPGLSADAALRKSRFAARKWRCWCRVRSAHQRTIHRPRSVRRMNNQCSRSSKRGMLLLTSNRRASREIRDR